MNPARIKVSLGMNSSQLNTDLGKQITVKYLKKLPFGQVIKLYHLLQLEYVRCVINNDRDAALAAIEGVLTARQFAARTVGVDDAHQHVIDMIQDEIVHLRKQIGDRVRFLRIHWDALVLNAINNDIKVPDEHMPLALYYLEKAEFDAALAKNKAHLAELRQRSEEKAQLRDEARRAKAEARKAEAEARKAEAEAARAEAEARKAEAEAVRAEAEAWRAEEEATMTVAEIVEWRFQEQRRKEMEYFLQQRHYEYLWNCNDPRIIRTITTQQVYHNGMFIYASVPVYTMVYYTHA